MNNKNYLTVIKNNLIDDTRLLLLFVLWSGLFFLFGMGFGQGVPSEWFGTIGSLIWYILGITFFLIIISILVMALVEWYSDEKDIIKFLYFYRDFKEGKYTKKAEGEK
jgi:hypothetical protein